MDYNQLDQFQKYLISIASLFHNIYIPRNDADGNVFKYITVPIVFAQNDKLYDIANSSTLINQINNNQVETNYPVPSMALELTAINVDHNRKLSEIHTLGENEEIYTPLPLKLSISLFIETKKLIDILKILEQILPIFPNKQAITVNVTADFSDEIIVVLNSITTNLPSEFERNVGDVYTAELEFEAAVKLFKIKRELPLSAEYEFSLYAKKTNDDYEELLNE